MGRLGTRELARRLEMQARALAALGSEPDVTIRGAHYHRRRRGFLGVRHAVQLLSLAVVVAIGAGFVAWVRGIEAGALDGTRPPGVEGFLPIAAIVSLRHLIATGEVHPVHPAALVILLVVLAVSVLLKKAFCSWLCPVGTVAEALGAVGRRLFRGWTPRVPRWIDVPLRGVKYLLLGFFLWSIFLVMPVRAVAAFLDSPYHRLADVQMLYFFERISPLALGVVIAIAAASVVVPFAWCRYLCPYGALTGLVSLLSPFKITRDAGACVDCGLCSRACPARLPVATSRRVRSDECSACLACVAACPRPQALRFAAPRPWSRPLRPAVVAAVLALFTLGGVAAARIAGVWETSIPQWEYVLRVRALRLPAGHPPVATPAGTVAGAPGHRSSGL